jgi:death-on-curing protein
MTIEQAVEIHDKTVDISGGGAKGQLDIGQLDSVLEHIQNDMYYPSFESKLTHLVFSACKFHCFQDGNKRISIALGAQFLLFNGYLFAAGSFLQEMENISYHVAAGAIDKDLLGQIIEELVNEAEISESTKLNILEVIS